MREVLQARGTVSGRGARRAARGRPAHRPSLRGQARGARHPRRGRARSLRRLPAPAGLQAPAADADRREATAVLLGLIVSRQTGISTEGSAVDEALAKIPRVLSTGLRDRVGALEGSLGWTSRPREPQPPATEVLLTLATAIRRKRRALIRYATPGRQETDRIVAPYGLVFHAAKWYLAADDERSGEIRSFRVDRVRSAELRPERASPSEGFDAVEHVERSIAATPWGWRLEIVFDTTLEEARRRIPRWVGDPEQLEEGVLLRAHADDLDAAARMLASLGWPFTVREPDELRESLRKVADIISGAAR